MHFDLKLVFVEAWEESLSTKRCAQPPFYTICLPIPDQDQAEVAARESAPNNQVLIVDDDPDIVDLLADFVSSYGMTRLNP